jgi:hypothetical protein
VLHQLRQIARDEGTTLAAIVREGLEMRARAARTLTFVGSVKDREPTAIADEAESLRPEPATWR